MPIFNWPRMVKKLKIDFLFCINHFRCDCVECLHFNMDDIGGITFIKLTGLNFGGITGMKDTYLMKDTYHGGGPTRFPNFVTSFCQNWYWEKVGKIKLLFKRLNYITLYYPFRILYV